MSGGHWWIRGYVIRKRMDWWVRVWVDMGMVEWKKKRRGRCAWDGEGGGLGKIGPMDCPHDWIYGLLHAVDYIGS